MSEKESDYEKFERDVLLHGSGYLVMTAHGPKYLPLEEVYEKADPDEAAEWLKRFDATA